MTTAADKAYLQHQGLYDPANEHDACGVGFVAHIKGQKSHAIVGQALNAPGDVVNLAAWLLELAGITDDELKEAREGAYTEKHGDVSCHGSGIKHSNMSRVIFSCAFNDV
jgi:hypothetical protein